MTKAIQNDIIRLRNKRKGVYKMKYKIMYFLFRHKLISEKKWRKYCDKIFNRLHRSFYQIKKYLEPKMALFFYLF